MSSRRRCYRPIDEALGDLRFMILRRIRRFDWAEPRQLAEAMEIPSDDVDPVRRNTFDRAVCWMTKRGYLERVGEPMSYVYRITDLGRAEYERQLARNAA